MLVRLRVRGEGREEEEEEEEEERVGLTVKQSSQRKIGTVITL